MFPDCFIYRSYRDALLINAAISSLVDEFTDCLEIRVSICDVWFNNPKHLDRRFCEANEDSIIDLEKAEELEGFARLGSDFIDTRRLSALHRNEDEFFLPLDAYDECKLRFSGHVKVTRGFRKASQSNLLPLGITILQHN